MQLVSIRLMAQPGKMSKSGHKCRALNFLSSIPEEDILLETHVCVVPSRKASFMNNLFDLCENSLGTSHYCSEHNQTGM